MLFEQVPGVTHPQMNKKQKLELTCIGKENRPRLEPRILLENTRELLHSLG